MSHERLQYAGEFAPAQLRAPASPNQLLGLSEELDLSNTAAAEFDVMAMHDNYAASSVGIDLAFHRMDVPNGRKVQILAPDKGPTANHAELGR